MRKWTMSACLVVASCVLPLMAATGSPGPGIPQASIGIASSSSSSSTKAAPAAQPATAVTLTAFTAAPKPATETAGTWTVRPGDTLSSIAVALAVPGGWQALYAANRRVVGPQPDLIRSGTVLQVAAERTDTVAPGDTLASIAAALRTSGGWQALYAANKRVIGQDPDIIRPGTTLTLPSQQAASPPALAPAPARGQHQAQVTAPATPKATAAQQAPARHDNTTAGGIMPRWLKLILLLAGLLTLTSFVIEPVAVLARRRRQATQAAQAAAQPAQAEEPPGDRPRPAKSRIIQADHDRLIVTYSAHDDTVYLLTPPGEDPWSVLRASRIVVPEHTFVELADHLGVPSVWPYE